LGVTVVLFFKPVCQPTDVHMLSEAALNSISSTCLQEFSCAQTRPHAATMQAMHMRASLLLLLVGLPCIQYAKCVLGDVSEVAMAASSDASASEPWWSAVQQCSVQCQQLQQKSLLHDIEYPTELVPVTWAVLLAGTSICLLVAVSAVVRLMQQRAEDKARFKAREQELQARFRGTRAQAADLGTRASHYAMYSRALAEQNRLLSQENLAQQLVQQQLQVSSGIGSSCAVCIPSVTALQCCYMDGSHCCASGDGVNTMHCCPWGGFS
jgi:hypothetical protein